MIDDYKTIETFRTNVLNTINSCNLTIGCAYYVLKNILGDLKDYYQSTRCDNNEEEGLINVNTLTGEITEKNRQEE